VAPGHEPEGRSERRLVVLAERGWIERSFEDSKGRFGLAEVRVSCPKRLSRLLTALTVALGWLTLMGLCRRWE
jgi:hypothetical protein